MTELPISKEDFAALLTLLTRLTGLIAPLEAILAAEEQTGLSETIEDLSWSIHQIGLLLGETVKLMEQNNDWQASVEQKLDKQSAAIAGLRDLLISIRSDLGLPLARRAAS